MANILVGPVSGKGPFGEEHIVWCKLCLSKRVKDITSQSEDNKLAFKKCEMKDWSFKDKLGLETRGKSCPNCQQTVTIWKEETTGK